VRFTKALSIFSVLADPILCGGTVFGSVPPLVGKTNFNLRQLGWPADQALRAARCRLFLLADPVLGREATPVRMLCLWVKDDSVSATAAA
jgi:hypothetical protein